MWFYRAIDEDGCYIAEDYSRQRLIEKLADEFGEDRLAEFRIVRLFDKNLK